MTATIAITDAPLYQQVAEQIAAMIDSGTLRSGDRVPSVRRLSRQMDVSISTVLQAYQLLESRGMISPRPQSGFYVRPAWRPPAPEPKETRPPAAPKKVTVASLVLQMMKAASDPSIVQIGSADPAEHCLPTQRLNRIQASLARRTRMGMNTYDHPPGLRELRIQIARLMMEANCRIHPDEILTTVGCQEAIGLCLRAVAKPGDVIAIESPTYYGHLQLIESLGMRALEVPTSPRTGIMIDAFEELSKKHYIAACLLVPTFHNPLGFDMPVGNKRQLVDMLHARTIPLIEDDVYGDLGFAPTRPPACKSFDRTGNVLLCSSFSKTLAPGARIGWCIAGQFGEKIELLKVASTLATPTLPQLTIAEFLAVGGYERHVRAARRKYAEQVQRYADAVSQYFPDGTRLSRPAGGYVLWVELPKKVDAAELAARALQKGICIAPGPIFSAGGKFSNCIRITCSQIWSERIDRALKTLGTLARTASL